MHGEDSRLGRLIRSGRVHCLAEFDSPEMTLRYLLEETKTVKQYVQKKVSVNFLMECAGPSTRDILSTWVAACAAKDALNEIGTSTVQRVPSGKSLSNAQAAR